MKNTLFIALQYLMPQHTLSRLAGLLGECRNNFVKSRFIRWFAKRYGVDMSEAEREQLADYRHFNDFFTRALKTGARPIDGDDDSVVCPADGSISQLGQISDGRIFQAKGQMYSTLELLGGSESLAKAFDGGHFATVYLSPKDYHRVHMPFAGRLRQMSVIPGELFSVNEVTAANVPRLFARNERVSCIFDTTAGPMAVVMVGAVIVAGIETVWAGELTPIRRRVTTTHYGERAGAEVALDKGAEMGRFKLGSTAIVLFARGAVSWEQSLQAGSATNMGQRLGTLNGS